MKWEKAVQVDNDVHFVICVDPDKCGTPDERHEQAVYGIDKVFTAERAAEEFARNVRAKYEAHPDKPLHFEGKEV